MSLEEGHDKNGTDRRKPMENTLPLFIIFRPFLKYDRSGLGQKPRTKRKGKATKEVSSSNLHIPVSSEDGTDDEVILQ